MADTFEIQTSPLKQVNKNNLEVNLKEKEVYNKVIKISIEIEKEDLYKINSMDLKLDCLVQEIKTLQQRLNDIEKTLHEIIEISKQRVDKISYYPQEKLLRSNKINYRKDKSISQHKHINKYSEENRICYELYKFKTKSKSE